MYSGRVSNEENDENGGNEDNVDKRPQKFVTFETLIITFLTIKNNNHNFHTVVHLMGQNSQFLTNVTFRFCRMNSLQMVLQDESFTNGFAG